MKRVVSVLLGLALGLLSDGATSAPGHPARVMGKAVSIGAPNEGHLEGGQRLDERPYLRMLPDHDHRWGLPHLVGMLDRGAARVNKRFPGSVLGVGDLSRRGGGDVAGHHSHESGRDADVAFYALDRRGHQVNTPRLAAFDEEGRAQGGLRFDDARNWALVESWLSDPQARVSHIFIAAHLRDRLLAYARQHNVPASLRNRAALAMMQPKHGLPHDNHFHVRIACPSSQRGTCVEYVVRERPTRLSKAQHAKVQRGKGRHGKGHDKSHGKAHDSKPHHGKAHDSKPHHGKANRAAAQVAPQVADHGDDTPTLSSQARHGSRPVLARARKRGGTTGEAAPSLVAVVPAPNDLSELLRSPGRWSTRHRPPPRRGPPPPDDAM